jgi:hypothetical protein
MSGQIVQRLQDSGFQLHYEHTAYDAGHSEWSIKPCRASILTFLKERFLAPPQERPPPAPK